MKNFPDFFQRHSRRRPLRPGEERRKEVTDRLSGKLSKQDAGYRPTPTGDKGSCAECEHYAQSGESTSNCRRVAGVVYAEDTCDVWVARAGENSTVQQPTGNRSI